MSRKVWSSLIIGIALGIFVTGTVYTYLFHDREPGASGMVAEEPEENSQRENNQKEDEEVPGSDENRKATMEIEIAENHSVEELVYDLMVEGIISSKHQQQEIYEVLIYEGLDPGTREIPVYASTERIIEALINP